MREPLFLRFLVAFLGNYCFLTIMLMANSSLSGTGTSLCFIGAVVLFPALRLPLTLGLTVTFLTALLWTALLPSEFHILGLLLIFAHFFLWRFRDHFNRDPWPKKMSLVLSLNFLCLLGLMLLGWPHGSGNTLNYLMRVVPDIVISLLLFPLVSLWYWKSQKSVLFLFENILSPKIQPINPNARVSR